MRSVRGTMSDEAAEAAGLASAVRITACRIMGLLTLPATLTTNAVRHRLTLLDNIVTVLTRDTSVITASCTTARAVRWVLLRYRTRSHKTQTWPTVDADPASASINLCKDRISATAHHLRHRPARSFATCHSRVKECCRQSLTLRQTTAIRACLRRGLITPRHRHRLLARACSPPVRQSALQRHGLEDQCQGADHLPCLDSTARQARSTAR